MPDDSSRLQITIDVVDSDGSVQTIQATTGAIEQLGAAGTATGASLGAVGSGAAAAEASMKGLGTAGTNTGQSITAGAKAAGAAIGGIGQELTAVGSASSSMADSVGNGMGQVSGHTMTALDNVRLLRDDFGIHIPRGMEMAISRSGMLSGAIGAMGGVLVGLGAAEIFYRMGAAIYDGYEKFISLTAAAKAYDEQVQKQKDADFTNTHSIETTRDRIDEATKSAKAFEAEGATIQSGAWKDIFSGNTQGFATGVASLVQGRQVADQGYKSQTQADQLSPKQLADQHELNTLQIESAHATDGSLQGQQKINAELAKTLALHKEDANYNKAQDAALQGKGVRSGGDQKQQLEDQIAQQTAAAQTIELQRQIRDKTISMQDEARNAGLQGNALYAAQEQEAIAAVERSATGSAGQVDAIRLKFHNMELQRLQAETDEVNKRARAEEEAGLTGMAKIQAQGNDRDADIQQKQDRGGYASAADADKDRETSHAQTLREMNDAEVAFNASLKALSDEAANHMTTGYAKVAEQESAAIEKAAEKFRVEYGQMDQASDRYKEAQSAVGDYVVNVEAQADRQRVELHAKALNEIQATEVQAARLIQTEDKAATGAIIDDFNRRNTEAKATLNQQLASNQLTAADQQMVWDEYYRRLKADADLAGAQMEKAAQQTRDRTADALGDLFSDPTGFLEKRAKDMMYKVLANGLMSATNNLQSDSGKWIAEILGMGPDMKAPTGTAGAGIAGGSPLTQSATSLTSAGTTLSTSGTNLGTAGTTLNNSGTSLQTAATALQNAASALTSAQGSGGGGGGFTGGSGGGDDTGDTGGYGGDDGGGDDSGGSSSTGITTGATAAAKGISIGSITGATNGVTSALATGGGAGSGLAAGAGITGAAVAGGVGLFNAYKNTSPGAGALSGAEAGAAIGGFAGPEGMIIGALIGGAAGAIAGFMGELFGDNGRSKAKAYDTSTVGPALAAELANFNSGQTGYTQASRDLTNILNQAQTSTNAMGSGARDYFNQTIVPEVAAVQAKIDAEEKGGRGRLTMSAAQFHQGGLITGFGDLATSGTEGFIHALMGERMMNPIASSTHGPFLDAMNAGHNPATILTSQMQGAIKSIAGGSTTRMGTGAGGNGATLNVSAIDAASFARQLRTGGLGKVIQQHLNGDAGTYGGKSDL